MKTSINKVALITGAGGRIGSTFAKALNANGYKLCLVDIDIKKLKKDNLNIDQDSYISIASNLDTKKKIDQIISKTASTFGRIDVVIHAAYPRSKKWGSSFEKLEKKYLCKDLSDQLGNAIILSQRVIKFFLNQKYGNLIHISSIQGISSPKFEHYKNTNMNSPIEYSAIKAGIISATKYLAKLYKKKNIRVNCISPGGIIDNQPLSFKKKYKNSCGSKGLLDAQDLISTLLFLVAEDSKYVNGQNIIVDDSWSL